MVYHAGRSSVMAYFFHLNQVMVGAPTDDPFRPIKHYPTLIPSQVTPPKMGAILKTYKTMPTKSVYSPAVAFFWYVKSAWAHTWCSITGNKRVDFNHEPPLHPRIASKAHTIYQGYSQVGSLRRGRIG